MQSLKIDLTRLFDIGCGEPVRLAAMFPTVAFMRGDYASSMIENARDNAKEVKNLELIITTWRARL
jgi:trans-aconitate methyltransferase